MPTPLPRPVIVTKVRPPRRRRDILPRPRLHQYLSDNLDRKLILVSAGAGYGKTSLLVDFIQAADLPVCWYRVEAADADPPAFFEHLIACLAQRYPGVGQRTRLMLYGEETLDIEAAVGSLVNEIADQVSELFLLVLDDYQNLDDAVLVNAAMDLFLHYLPDNCRVILASRTLPKKLTLTRLAGEGQVAGLGRDYLRFSRDEIRALAAHLHGQELSAAECANLERLSEGWIAALVLASGGPLGATPSTQAAAPGDHGQLFDYLAQEVLTHQSPARQSFLLRTSILDTLTPDLCDAVLEISGSAALLRELEEQNLFLVPFDTQGLWYRYHPLFQEFLRARLAAETAIDAAGLHRRAAVWCAATNHPEEEVQHLLAAGDHAAAAAGMLRQVNGLAAAGRWRQIVRWTEALPPDLLAAQPVLLERLGAARTHLGDIREGLEALDQAVTILVGQDDRLALAEALVQRGPALRLLGRLEEAEADSRRALKLAGDEPCVAAGEAYRNLGACLALHGRMDEARQELEAALRCFEVTGPPTLAAHTHTDLAALYQLAGDADAALGHSEAARRHYERVGNIGALAMAMNNSAMALHAQGRFEDARVLLTEAAERTRVAGAMRTEALVLVGLGDVLADLDAFEEAITHYQRGLTLARQVGDLPLVVYGLAAWAESLRLSGAAAEGRSLLAQAQDEIGPYHYAYESAHLAFVRGALALERHDHEVAEAHFQAALGAFRDIGSHREAARAALYMVALAVRRGDRLGADVAWRNALGLLQDLEYPASLAPTVRRLPEVQERLARAPAALRQALTALPTGPAAPPEPVTAPRPAATVTPALAVLALGTLEVRRDGQRLEAGAWRTAVARDVFLYLADRPEGATRLELMAAFWPDSSETRARGSLHSSVYRARAAVGRGCVVAEADRYRVPRGPGLFYDVAALEARLAQAAAARDGPARAAALEAALGLVRGAYLDGISEDWCHDRREALEVTITDALLDLARAYLDLGSVADAIATYRRAIERDCLREDAHRGLMRAYAAAGDRTRALVQYERLVAVLDEELGAPPDATTTALERAIRAEQPLPQE